jgi:hypothetical protein
MHLSKEQYVTVPDSKNCSRNCKGLTDAVIIEQNGRLSLKRTWIKSMLNLNIPFENSLHRRQEFQVLSFKSAVSKKNFIA